MTIENQENNSMEELMEQMGGSIKTIHKGDIITGKVISVTEEEVMVNIGYITDGIITKTELTYENVNPKDIVKVDDEIKVCIMEVNDGDGNVMLSKKKADAVIVWNDLEKLYKSDETLDVKVKEVVKGGVVADVNGIRGFIPASQLSVSFVKDLTTYVGKELLVKVIEFDREKRKVVLSRKVIEQKELEVKKEALWSSLKKGEKRTGTVVRLAKFGAFVDLGGLDGLVHVTEMSWKRINDPSEVVSVGDEVEVYVLDFDKEKGRVSLGLKDVKDNPWLKAVDELEVNSIVEGTIVRLADFGAFVEIKDGVQGLVHVSQISEDRITKPSDVLKEGDKVKVKILGIEKDTEKISLSIKEAANKPQEDLQKYNDNADTLTMGDLLGEKLKNFKFEE